MTISREQMLNLDNNPDWRAMVKEMDKVIAAESEKLLHCPVEQAARLQERVKALRLCTRFPQMLAEREENEDESSILTAG